MSEHCRRPVILVHGGGWSAIHHDGIAKKNMESGVMAAARAGWAKLQDNTQCPSAVEAVQAAVMYMENSPHFNAGKVIRELFYTPCR